MSGILKIKLGEEYKAKVENISEFDNSIFKDIYIKGFESLISILNSNPSEKEKLHENYNNIIAFVGERGTGKTSAMLSFAGALNKNALNTPNLNFFKNFDIDKINSKIFSHIGVIDPSLLSHNNNILEIIVAKLFQSFKLTVENKNKDYDENKKRDLIGHFEKVYENIRIINNKKDVYQDEALDALLKMSATTDLKDNLIKLVSSYLAFMNKLDANNIENSKLVIQVDDIDLNTKHAYEMVEQIRKYLILPNVIILMAVKVEQLSQIIERNYRTEFDILFKDNNMHYDEIKNMAEKYLEKFIPLERRLYLPKLNNVDLDIQFEIYCQSDQATPAYKKNSIDKGIRELIYLKTDMIFIDGKYLLPDNLRGIIHLILFLYKMKDVRDYTNKLLSRFAIIKNDNYIKFKEYFFDSWIKLNLNHSQQKTIKELLEREVTEKNKFIINKTEDIYSLLRKDVSSKDREGNSNSEIEEKEYQNIVNLNNRGHNISLGDLLFVLNKTDRYKIDIQDKKFIYAIKIAYSFMLYELYAIDEEKFKNNTVSEETYSDYQKLLGGYVYNTYDYKLMRNKNNGNSRNRSLINFKKIEELLNHYNLNDTQKTDIIDSLNLFIVKSNEFNDTTNYRKENDLFYSKKQLSDILSQNSKPLRIEFDILGFLFHIDFSKANDFYIGNIELFEEVLKSDYRQNSYSSEFFENFKLFFDIFSKLEIDLKFGKKHKIGIGSKIDKINTFIEIINKNSELKKIFEEIFKDLIKLKEVSESLILKIFKGIDSVEITTIKKDIKNNFKKDIFTKNASNKIIQNIKLEIEQHINTLTSKDKHKKSDINTKINEIIKKHFPENESGE